MDKNVQFTNLPVMILQEGSYLVAYTPALDLSVQGKTKVEVQERFGEAVQLFFEELQRMGTLDEMLEELGWVKQTNVSKQSAWMPPQVVTDSPSQIEVQLPAFV